MPPLMMSPELPPSPAASDQLVGAGKVAKAPQARNVAANQASIAMNSRSGLSWLSRFTTQAMGMPISGRTPRPNSCISSSAMTAPG